MKELTFGELKQALACCTIFKSCHDCPLFDRNELKTVSAGDPTCTQQLMTAAMNCINIMEKDLVDANKRAEMWEAAATQHEQEIFRLHESLDRK